MAAATYESALRMAQSLSPDDRSRLIRELTTVAQEPSQSSILELCGLGAEIWQEMDAQEYIRSERATWAG